jgi:hypothetical protein
VRSESAHNPPDSNGCPADGSEPSALRSSTGFASVGSCLANRGLRLAFFDLMGTRSLFGGSLADSERLDFRSSTRFALADVRLANRGPRPRFFDWVGTLFFISRFLASLDPNPKGRPGSIHSVQTDGQLHLLVGLERLTFRSAVSALECAAHVIITAVARTRIGLFVLLQALQT